LFLFFLCQFFGFSVAVWFWFSVWFMFFCVWFHTSHKPAVLTGVCILFISLQMKTTNKALRNVATLKSNKKSLSLERDRHQHEQSSDISLLFGFTWLEGLLTLCFLWNQASRRLLSLYHCHILTYKQNKQHTAYAHAYRASTLSWRWQGFSGKERRTHLKLKETSCIQTQKRTETDERRKGWYTVKGRQRVKIKCTNNSRGDGEKIWF